MLFSYHAHMYDFIRPSFSTLVALDIHPDSDKLDLLLLRPLGGTLREFAYRVNGFDPAVLETIPVVFPHLTGLELVLKKPTGVNVQWEVCILPFLFLFT